MPRTITKRTLLAASLLAAAALLLTSLPVPISEAQPPAAEHRAGSAGFRSGQAGIYVTLSSPMPSTDYAVVVQPTNTAGYSTTTDCTFFNVLKKTRTNFQVQHKTCADGRPLALDVNVSLNWIAWTYK